MNRDFAMTGTEKGSLLKVFLILKICVTDHKFKLYFI